MVNSVPCPRNQPHPPGAIPNQNPPRPTDVVPSPVDRLPHSAGCSRCTLANTRIASTPVERAIVTSEREGGEAKGYSGIRDVTPPALAPISTVSSCSVDLSFCRFQVGRRAETYSGNHNTCAVPARGGGRRILQKHPVLFLTSLDSSRLSH